MVMSDVEWLVNRVDNIIHMDITEAQKLDKLMTVVTAVKYDLGMELVNK